MTTGHLLHGPLPHILVFFFRVGAFSFVVGPLPFPPLMYARRTLAGGRVGGRYGWYGYGGGLRLLCLAYITVAFPEPPPPPLMYAVRT